QQNDFFSRRGRFNGLLALPAATSAIHGLDHQEYDEGQQDEADEYGEKVTPGEQNRPCARQVGVGFRPGVTLGPLQHDVLVGEIGRAAQDEVDDRHDD